MSVPTASPPYATHTIEMIVRAHLELHPERRVHCDSAWLYVDSTKPMPDQGWKLHVSATPQSAITVLEHALPILVAADVEFKTARSIQQLSVLNQGIMGMRSQMGKFITIYPIDDAQAVALAQQLHAATQGLEGPVIPSDRPLHPGSLVHYRYGGFRQQLIVSPVSIMTPALRDPEGRLEPDKRKPWFNTPAWVQDPFEAAGITTKAVAASGPIGTRYRIRKALQQNGKGGVYVATDTSANPPRTVVIKEARRLVSTDDRGRDARDRLNHEYAMLRRLQPNAYLPDVYDSFEQEGNRYIALEFLTGVSLRASLALKALQGTVQPIEWIVAVAEQLIALMEHFHHQKIILRDFNPNNVLITPEQTLKLIDLELTHPLDDDITPFGGWTRGYSRLDSREAGHQPTYADDYFALGATLFYLATAADPLLPDDQRPLQGRLSALLAQLRPDIPSGLRRTIEHLLNVDAQPVPSLAALREQLRDSTPAATLDSPSATCDWESYSRSIGEWLLETEQPAGAPHLWEPSEGGRTMLPINTQHGAAGVGLFLTALYQQTRRPEFLEAAQRALAWCQRWVETHADLQATPGLYFGHGGMAWLAVQIARQTGTAEDIRRAETAVGGLDDLPTPHIDISHGLAGVGMAHLAVARLGNHPTHWQRCQAIADQLVAAAVPLHSGLGWELRMGPEPETYYGYAHGAAGIGYFLLEMARATGEQRYLDCAAAAAQAIFDAHVEVADGTGWSWPHSPRQQLIWPHFCNGASGIGTFLIRMYAETSQSRYLDAATKAATVAFNGCRSTQAGLCHGIAGEADFMIDMYQATHNPHYLRQAQSLANLLVLRGKQVGERLLWETDGTPLVTADLMVGNAGIGAVFLRLARPESQERTLFFALAQ